MDNKKYVNELSDVMRGSQTAANNRKKDASLSGAYGDRLSPIKNLSGAGMDRFMARP